MSTLLKRVQKFLRLIEPVLIAIIAGLVWGVLRIMLILILPYFYLIWYVPDTAVYIAIGTLIRQRLEKTWQNEIIIAASSALLIGIIYLCDRSLAQKLIIGTYFDITVLPLWRAFYEIVVVVTAFLA